MAKTKFDNYKDAEFFEHEYGKFAGPNDVQGGGSSVDPYGDSEKKGKSDMDMNAAQAFNAKDFTKVEAMGTEYAKGKNTKVRSDNTGDHFSVDEVDPMGNDAAKKSSFQSRH